MTDYKPLDYITTRQAAEYAGLSQRAIQDAILRGALPYIKPGHDALVRFGDLQGYLNDRPEQFQRRRTRKDETA